MLLPDITDIERPTSRQQQVFGQTPEYTIA